MENKKPAPHNPIITFDEGRDQELLAISKSAEDKLYMLMFFNPSIEGTELIQFIGRTNCYFGIKVSVRTTISIPRILLSW